MEMVMMGKIYVPQSAVLAHQVLVFMVILASVLVSKKASNVRSEESLGPSSKELCTLKFIDLANPACGEIVSAIQFYL